MICLLEEFHVYFPHAKQNIRNVVQEVLENAPGKAIILFIVKLCLCKIRGTMAIAYQGRNAPSTRIDNMDATGCYQRPQPMTISPRRSFIIAIGVIVLLALAFAGVRFMNVPSSAHRAVAAWGEVERQFKLRAYLTPDVIDVVRRIAPSETDLLKRLEDTRMSVINYHENPRTPYSLEQFREFMATQDALSVALGQVLDLVNANKAEKSTPSVAATLQRLEQSESRIVIARSDYVGAAGEYNTLVKAPPTVWIAHLLEPAVSPMVPSFTPARQGS